ncbi:MAG: hypothetical protein V4547_15190 [Bacteroidota bacterium]
MKRILTFLISSVFSMFLLVLFYGYSSINNEESTLFEYNLSKPTKNFVLPAALNEISGITTLSQNEIACVQDEIGTIFIYDLTKEVIIKEYPSKLIGDFEEIALVGNAMYLLRSDGVLIEHKDYSKPSAEKKEYTLHLPSSNNEGLCFDKKNNRLLIAAKSKAGKGNENKDIRLIYGFDLKNKILSKEPIFKLSVDKIEEKALAMKIPIPTRTIKKTGKEVSDFNFRPSAIAVHPFSHLIYILSSSDKLLLIMNEKGHIIQLFALDPVLFNKAEGITFLPDGDMLISNEAQKGKPTLLKFKYIKK